MNIKERAGEYLKNIGDSVIVENVMANFALQEIELAMCDLKNEKNNLSDQKESHRRTQRNLRTAIELLKAVLGKDDFIKLLQDQK